LWTRARGHNPAREIDRRRASSQQGGLDTVLGADDRARGEQPWRWHATNDQAQNTDNAGAEGGTSRAFLHHVTIA
jgi:hypothetical protein